MISPTGKGARVSIVIPCYNRAALIGDAIESALANGEGAEVIVVDDGSTDASWDRIQAFGESVRAFRIPNTGVSAARNFGVDQANGDHIKFLDSDDRLPPGGVAALMTASQTVPSTSIVFGDACSIGVDGQAISPFGYGFADLAPPGPLARATLLSGVMSPLLPLYPAEALRRIGFDPAYSLGEDQELAVRLVLSGYDFHRVPVIVAEVREHSGDRLSRTGLSGLFDRHVLLFAGILRHFEAAEASLTAEEALALARTIWTVARDAARARCRAQASRLFAIATGLAGPTRAAPPRLRPLYKMLDPYKVERLVEMAKSLRRHG